uniref:Uncharacterized protein n=1 Tax=Sphaerodactylus townsendi TaxID=933632 RepID=A0ACB8G2S8_9SAUR
MLSANHLILEPKRAVYFVDCTIHSELPFSPETVRMKLPILNQGSMNESINGANHSVNAFSPTHLIAERTTGQRLGLAGQGGGEQWLNGRSCFFSFTLQSMTCTVYSER